MHKVGGETGEQRIPQQPTNLAVGLEIRAVPQFLKLETSQHKDVPGRPCPAEGTPTPP